MNTLYSFRVEALPSSVDYRALFGALSGTGFLLCHDTRNADTRIVSADKSVQGFVESRVKGARLVADEYSPRFREAITIVPFLYLREKRRRDEEEPQPFEDMYQVLQDSIVVISFLPDSIESVEAAKERAEHALSGKEVRITKFLQPGSVQSELYYESDERHLLTSMLEMLNNAILENGLSCKVAITILDPSEAALSYVKSKVVVLGTLRPKARNLEELIRTLEGVETIPYSHEHASRMISFSDRIPRKVAIPTRFHKGSGELRLGTYMDQALFDTGEPVSMPAQNLNLGVIIAGLPGTGKSFAAMQLIGQTLSSEKPMVAVITPTEEWNSFAATERMEVMRLYSDPDKINFFRCDAGINIERFYENLAMLMASASNAGPYRNSMEKCLLSAFRKVYATTNAPDPIDVYDAIEEAVIERHGKRSNTGVKYTKHGENIIAALESLRLMLFKPQFAYREGVSIFELLRSGIVFDLSQVSNSMKPFFYALLLNQIYGFADELDSKGDGELRMLICVEEAQLIFDPFEQSAASQDLRQRIQDFRKRGIGLMLITHSVTDINIGIRRLCQTKLYFRQGADAVRHAASDLVFEESLHEAIMDKLKTLEQRVCAAEYMTLRNDSKEPSSPVFVRTDSAEYKAAEPSVPSGGVEKRPQTTIQILKVDGEPAQNAKIAIRYVGTPVFFGRTDDKGTVIIEDLLTGRPYKVTIFGDKKKDNVDVAISGGENERFKKR